MLKLKSKIISYFLFFLIFIYTFSWIPINLFLSSLKKEKNPITIINNQEIEDLIFGKTNINLQTIKISETTQPFGIMIGIPTKPQLILSRELYNSFDRDELEYVILHEIGHYKLRHTIIELIAVTLLLIIGILILKKIKASCYSIIIAVILGLVFGVFMNRLDYSHEIEADNFTLNKISNPLGMIEATKKFQNYHGKKYTQVNNKLIKFLFYRSNPYENRIKMAEKEIKFRGN